jgi:cytochrome c-type biogenesis protein CcmH/NrfG
MTEQFQRAQQLFEQNNLVESMEVLNQVISDNPIDCQSVLLRGKIYYKSQQWGNAMNDFASVLEIEPGNQEAKSGLQMAKNILGYFTPDMFNP